MKLIPKRVNYYNVSLTFNVGEIPVNFESVYATTDNFDPNKLQDHFGKMKINNYRKISEFSYLYHSVKQRITSPVRFIYE